MGKLIERRFSQHSPSLVNQHPMRLAILILLSSVTFSPFTQAQEIPPTAVLVGQPYIHFDKVDFINTVPIKNFKCLVHGENVQREPACEYYSANIQFNSSPLYFQNSVQTTPMVKLCFKEVTRVSYPRKYEPSESYSLWFNQWGANIISNAPMGENIYNIESKLDAPKSQGFVSGEGFDPTRPPISTAPKHAITQIYLYDCDIEYDGKSYN